jgi:hypothetical protein
MFLFIYYQARVRVVRELIGFTKPASEVIFRGPLLYSFVHQNESLFVRSGKNERHQVEWSLAHCPAVRLAAHVQRLPDCDVRA